MRLVLGLVAALLAVPALIQPIRVPPAWAEGPAVSAPNGKVSVEGGVSSSSGQSSAVGTAQGALTLPAGHSFGVEVDALASTSRNAFAGGGLAQVFWRDPELGMAGPFAGLVGGNGTRLALGGGEAQLFAANLTLQAFGGYADATTGSPVPGLGGLQGGFYGSHLTLYPHPDLALTVGGQVAVGRGTGTARAEFLPDFTPHRNVSLFVSASAGDNQAWRVTGGIRVYFGPDKSLIRRHREDDQSYDTLMSTREALANALYAASLNRDALIQAGYAAYLDRSPY
jgi:hypothetical protein